MRTPVSCLGNLRLSGPPESEPTSDGENVVGLLQSRAAANPGTSSSENNEFKAEAAHAESQTGF